MKYLNQLEASEYLRLSKQTLERHRRQGIGPRFTKAGRRVLYPVEELDRWLDGRTYSSTSQYKNSGD